MKLNRHIWSSLEITYQESDTENNNGELDSHCISPGQENCQAFGLEVSFEDTVKFIPEKVESRDKFSPPKKEYTILKPVTWTHIILCGRRSKICLHLCCKEQRSIQKSPIITWTIEATITIIEATNSQQLIAQWCLSVS